MQIVQYNGRKTAVAVPVIQGSAVADKPARRAASWRTCCKQITWTLSVINLRPSEADSVSRRKSPIFHYLTAF